MRKRRNRVLLNLILAVMAVIQFIPVYYMIVTTLKPAQEASASPLGFPAHIDFGGYISAFQKMQYPRAFCNTLIITVFSVAGIVICSSMGAYVLARKQERKVCNVVFMVILAGMLFPYQMSILGLYKLIQGMGLMNSLLGLILVNITLGLPYSMLLFRSFIGTVPLELEEAASMEGCGPFQTFWRITFPLMKPIVATVIVLDTLTVWNDFMGPLYFIQSREKGVILQEVYRNVGQFSTDWTSLFSMLVLAVLPIILFYLFMQRYIIEGVTGGSVKG